MDRDIKKVISKLFSILIIFLLVFIYNKFFVNKNSNVNKSNINLSSDNVNSSKFNDLDFNNDNLNILFMYVGQADSTFIKYRDKTMLIDAGNNEDGMNVVDFLKS